MAQLKDSLITGDLRVTGTIYGDANLGTLNASGTGLGTDGQILKTTGTGLAWVNAADTHNHDSLYVNVSGDTMTGALNFANNVYNKVGDDVQIGDINQAGKLGIKGINGATGIQFVPYSGSTSQTLSIDGAGKATLTGLFVISNNNNTVTIGSQNASYTHIYNSANIPFIFNQDVLVTGQKGLGNTTFPIGRLQLGKADDGIYYQGTKANYRMIRMLDNTADGNGNGISIGGGGISIFGSGEYSDNLIANKSLTGGDESTYIGADGYIYIEAGGQTIGNRIGFQVDTSGNIIPIKAEAGNNNAQTLGSSSYKWSNVYATTFTGNLSGNASTATKFSSNQSITLTGDTTGTASSQAGWSIATTTKKLSQTNITSLSSFTDENALIYAAQGGSNSVTDKPTGVDAFGVISLKTAAGWYGQLLISSNNSSGIYWRTATSLSGGWRKIYDTSNKPTAADVGLGNVANKTITVTTTSVSDGTTTFNKYSHPTSAGNKHIPSGGSTGQLLKYSGSSGTAAWSTFTTNTPTAVTKKTVITGTQYDSVNEILTFNTGDSVNVTAGTAASFS